MEPRFAETLTALRQVMLDNASGMTVARDGEGGLVLRASFANPLKPSEPMTFGMVNVTKGYVSYHLMPLYMNPTLTALVPASLKARMQGKTCFNFKTVDKALFAELGELTARCATGFEGGLARIIEQYKAAKAQGVRLKS